MVEDDRSVKELEEIFESLVQKESQLKEREQKIKTDEEMLRKLQHVDIPGVRIAASDALEFRTNQFKSLLSEKIGKEVCGLIDGLIAVRALAGTYSIRESLATTNANQESATKALTDAIGVHLQKVKTIIEDQASAFKEEVSDLSQRLDKTTYFLSVIVPHLVAEITDLRKESEIKNNLKNSINVALEGLEEQLQRLNGKSGGVDVFDISSSEPSIQE